MSTSRVMTNPVGDGRAALRRYSLRLARLRRASRSSLHRSEVCQLRLELLQRLHLQLAYALAAEPKLAPDRLERLRLALKAEATLDDQPLPFRQPFQPALHRLPEKRLLCLLDGVTGSRIGKEVGECHCVTPFPEPFGPIELLAVPR